MDERERQWYEGVWIVEYVVNEGFGQESPRTIYGCVLP